MTTEAYRRREKRITRRLGWGGLVPGEHFVGVERAMGIAKGGHQVVLGESVCVSNRSELLEDLLDPDKYSPEAAKREMVLEGFSELEPWEFVEMFRRANHRLRGPYPLPLNRIEFEYADEAVGRGLG